MTIETARSGDLYAKSGALHIHSSFNPKKEAEKFIDSHCTGSSSVFLVLGPGLSYIQPLLNARFPHSRVISLFYHTLFYQRFDVNDKNSWFPEFKETLPEFLRNRIHEYDSDGLCVVEWAPSARIFPKVSRYVNSVIHQLLREYSGSMAVTRTFGKKWFLNTITNYISIDQYAEIRKANHPVVIAASGPSLEQSLTLLRKYRKKYYLWALPSSLNFLTNAGISPDMIISTDPGFFAGYHLVSLEKYSDVPVAMPLTSHPLPRSAANCVIPLHQHTWIEKLFLPSLSLPFLNAGSHGTVAGTALEMTRYASPPAVLFTGLDLCFFDIQEHVKPHTFDTIIAASANRMSSIETLYTSRAIQLAPKLHIQEHIRTSISLETYTGWFRDHIEEYPVPCYRILPSPVIIDGFGSLLAIDIPGFFSAWNNNPGEPYYMKKNTFPRDERKKRITCFLTHNIHTLDKFLSTTRENGLPPEGERTSVFELLYQLDLPSLQAVYKKVRKEQAWDTSTLTLLFTLLEDTIRFLRNMNQIAGSL